METTMTDNLGMDGFTGSPTHLVFDLHNFKRLEKKVYISASVCCHGYEWNIKLFPWGQSEQAEAEENTSIFLHCQKTTPEQPWPRVKFDISVGEVRRMGQPYTYKKHCSGWGWDDFAKHSDMVSNLDSKGTLVVHVHLSIQPLWYPKNPIQQRLKQAFADMKDADVAFVLPGGILVHAHQLVLSMYSPVLMEFVAEVEDAHVEMEWEDPDMFATMIRFMYTYDLPNEFDLKKDGIDLLLLANKFGCIDLKMVLEAKFIESGLVTAENAAGMLLIGDCNAAALLKEASMDSIIRNPTVAMETEEWKELQKSHRLMTEVSEWKACIQRRRQANYAPENLSVCALKKHLADKEKDCDGTREILVMRLSQAQSDKLD